MHLVEVENFAYRDAAAALEIRVENLKMRIFRARRKMYNVMKRSFSGANAMPAKAAPKASKGLFVGENKGGVRG